MAAETTRHMHEPRQANDCGPRNREPFGPNDPIVIGFRSTGALSVFFGGDTAYHFNSDRELRRAYVEGLLFKSEEGQLVSLKRIRQNNEVQLIRRELSPVSQAAFLATLRATLANLAQQIDQGELTVVGQLPAEADVVSRALKWLKDELPIAIAQSPHAGALLVAWNALEDSRTRPAYSSAKRITLSWVCWSCSARASASRWLGVSFSTVEQLLRRHRAVVHKTVALLIIPAVLVVIRVDDRPGQHAVCPKRRATW